MMAAVVLAAVCIPNIPATTPTPVLTWDRLPVETTHGYSLYYRYPGGTFQKVVDLRCQDWDWDEDGIGEAVICRGGDFGVPVQRYRNDEGVEVDWCVDAYNGSGHSSSCSNVVRVCMPQVWQPGEAYQ